MWQITVLWQLTRDTWHVTRDTGTGVTSVRHNTGLITLESTDCAQFWILLLLCHLISSHSTLSLSEQIVNNTERRSVSWELFKLRKMYKLEGRIQLTVHIICWGGVTIGWLALNTELVTSESSPTSPPTPRYCDNSLLYILHSVTQPPADETNLLEL